MPSAPVTSAGDWLKVVLSASVRAAREQCDQQRQIPRRKEQLIGMDPRRLGRTSGEAQAMALHEIVQVLDTDSREVHDLCMSEEFLARFDSYH